MAGIFDAADRYREDLLRRERRAASELVRYYGRIWQEINRQISKMVRDYYNTPDTERESWLYQMQRLQALRAQVEDEIGRFARFADRQIQTEQRDAVQAAQDHAEQLGRLGLGKGPPGVEVRWNRLPNEALKDLIGFLQDGSPLKDLLGRLGPEAGQAVMDALVRGLGLGRGPEVIGRLIQQMMGMALTRALRIARTEMLRAYREAAHRNYQANSDVVKGWIWHSALNERTCAACWAMHGTVHRLEERLDDHVCGRCTAVPLTKTWAELGFEGIPETTLPIEQGVDVFQRLSPEMQQKILGMAKYAAWKDGKFNLEDLVGRKYDGRWGSMRYERSLKSLGIDWHSYIHGSQVTQVGQIGQAVQNWMQRGQTIEQHLAGIVNTTQHWSGQVHVIGMAQAPGYLGRKDWNCDITLRSDADVSTLMHELLHGHSEGLTRQDYKQYPGWEEGVVEKLQRLLGPRVLTAAGETPVVSTHAYNRYIRALDRLRKWSGLGEEDFYLQMIHTPLADRSGLAVTMLVNKGYKASAAKGLVTKIGKQLV